MSVPTPFSPCTQPNGKPGVVLIKDGNAICIDPTGALQAGAGALFQGPDWLAGLLKIAGRVAEGIAAVVLIAIGLLMIGGEATLTAAAGRFGRELRKAAA